MKIWVLVNPRAGSGRSVSRARAFVERVPEATLVETTGTTGAISLARDAANNGVDVLVAVGGDGTLQQCATGLCLDEAGNQRDVATELLMIPAGTGGDYRRSFSIKDSIDEAVARLAQPDRVAVDVGHLTYQREGVDHQVAFINVLSFGLGGLADRIVETSPKWLGGRATYLLAALRATMVYVPSAVELWIDDCLVETAPLSNVAVCLGKYFGGGMKIAPDADPSDGLFDIVTMELGKLRTIGLTSHIYQGTHLKQAGVKAYRGKTLVARAARNHECLVDADGEPTGTLPISVRLMPKALTLLT